MRLRKKIVGSLRALIPMVGIVVASLASPALAGQKAPNFNLKTLDGGRMSLGDMLGEGPVLLNFWASWCKPCAAEAPHLVELYESYGPQGFHIVGISVDNVSSLSKLKAKTKKLKLPYPVLLDPSSTYARKLQVNVLPTNVLLDKDGNILRTFTGYRPGDEKTLAADIAALLVAGDAGDEPGAEASAAEEPAGTR